ncbi:MAG TPA: DNA oxidative demethylase AlkB [Sphingobium sp.]|uniref:DNA oxidative demethylase AlkB n=1 Tax=Sphingobium sp. TaxID=1912891 RepID=UPI002ED4C2A1
MMRHDGRQGSAMIDLFEDERHCLPLDPGAALLGGFASGIAPALVEAIDAMATIAPFRHLETPGGGRMSVAMTTCGELGWVSDRSGYRYARTDPLSGHTWPAMPLLLRDLAGRAAEAAGYPDFHPDACLINRYEPNARLSLHQDRDEATLAAPIVSVSLGVSATFLWGGHRRTDRPRRHRLHHGDVVVWGGPARMTFHGVDPVPADTHPLTGPYRLNLTFRCAGLRRA